MEEEPSEPAATAEPEGSSPSKEDRTWALVAHIGPVLVSLMTGGILSPIVPLVIYLAKRDESDFVADQARESLNFRITLFIGYLIGVILAFFVIGLCLLPVIWVLELVFGILAGIKAYDGVRYRYPFAIRLVT